MSDPPRILVLRGITRQDIPSAADIFDQRLLEDARAVPESAPVDGKPEGQGIAPLYVEGEEWVPNDIDCWNCLSSFDTPPAFIPQHVKKLGDGRLEMGVLGNFCSFNCGARHINERYGSSSSLSHQNWPYHANLALLYYVFTGVRVEAVAPAPHYLEFARFGGDMTPEDFSQIMRDLDAENKKCFRSGAVTVVPDRRRGVSGWEIAGVETRRPHRPPSPRPASPAGPGGAPPAKPQEVPGPGGLPGAALESFLAEIPGEEFLGGGTKPGPPLSEFGGLELGSLDFLLGTTPS